jgi:hypothetical protein
MITDTSRRINLSLLAELMGYADTSSLESYTKFLTEDKKKKLGNGSFTNRSSLFDQHSSNVLSS